jgi:hypothetical protein
MDERVEAFLADVLALEGETANAIRETVRGALADYEQLFRAQEVNQRMRKKPRTPATRAAGLASSRRYGCERERRLQST